MGTSAFASGKQARVALVVDDNPLIRRAICEELTSAGFDSCVEAENGAEAISEAAKVNPHLVILDLAMPVMNGLKAAPLLRRMLPTSPIILFTLHGPILSKTDFSGIGVTAVVSKDEPLQKLVSTATSLMAANR